MLRPAGCSKILQNTPGGGRKTRRSFLNPKPREMGVRPATRPVIYKPQTQGDGRKTRGIPGAVFLLVVTKFNYFHY